MSEEKPKATPGWYIDKRWPGEERRWDGQGWLDHWRPASSGSGPGWWMFFGLLIGIGGGLLTGITFSIDERSGWIALWVSAGVAGTVFNIGAIGKAVEIGIRAARG